MPATDQTAPAGTVPPQNAEVVADGTIIDLTNAVTLPSKRDYTNARTQFGNANSKAASVLLAIVKAGAWDQYVGDGDEPATPQMLFSDFLGELALPGKSGVRNEIIILLNHQHGMSMQAIADALNMSKPGVQYVLNPPARKTPEVESGEGTGDGDETPETPADDKPKQKAFKVALTDVEKVAALLAAAGIEYTL